MSNNDGVNPFTGILLQKGDTRIWYFSAGCDCGEHYIAVEVDEGGEEYTMDQRVIELDELKQEFTDAGYDEPPLHMMNEALAAVPGRLH